MSQAKNTDLCEYNKLKRPRYFHGMLLDEKDFDAQQAYHMSKRRIFNRMLHGWGVVCGLGLKWKKGKQSITVLPGLALDCVGNEIWVSDPYSVDLTKLLSSPRSSRDDCGEDQETRPEPEFDLCLYYREVTSDPVPVYASGGDCKDQTCDYSRIKEGFCIRLQDPCDDSGRGGGLVEEFCLCKDCGDADPCDDPLSACAELDCVDLDGEDACKCRALARFCSHSLPCPDCHECHCGVHCIVLGRLKFNVEGCLDEVCINECRRYVLSGRMVQHLFTSVYAGTEKWFTWKGEPLPSPERMVRNPIFALCWIVRRFFMKGTDWKNLVPSGDDDFAIIKGSCLDATPAAADTLSTVNAMFQTALKHVPDSARAKLAVDLRWATFRDDPKVLRLAEDAELRIKFGELEERYAVMEERLAKISAAAPPAGEEKKTRATPKKRSPPNKKK